MRTVFIVVLVGVVAYYLYTKGIFDKLSSMSTSSDSTNF